MLKFHTLELQLQSNNILTFSVLSIFMASHCDDFFGLLIFTFCVQQKVGSLKELKQARKVSYPDDTD